MDIIRENKLRQGNFTNSKIWTLLTTGKQTGGFGEKGWTYICERNFERQMDLPLTVETSNHNFSWGKVCEIRIFELLPTSYQMMSRETLQHPTIEYWTGSPDGKNVEYFGGIEEDKPIEKITGVEFKCPITRKSYMQFYNCKDIQEAREMHNDCEGYYWQTTAGGMLIIADDFVKKGLSPEEAVEKMIHTPFEVEMIVYMPYFSELQEIREIAQNMDVADPYQFFWIFNGNDEELPYLKDLKDGGKVNHQKKFTWTPSKEEKARLTEIVKKAGTYLIPRHQLQNIYLDLTGEELKPIE